MPSTTPPPTATSSPRPSRWLPPVTNGLFTATLDFGPTVFTGPNRWLEISLTVFGADQPITTLISRQPLTPTPYALHAHNAANLMSFANAPIDIKVNGQRAFRLEPNASGPNVIGGSEDNFVAPGYAGGTIAGGSENRSIGYWATVGGGRRNTSDGAYATVGGGSDNRSYGYGTVGGGSANTAGHEASTVAGGASNRAEADYATIGGGAGNISDETGATVGGGRGNSSTGPYATIAGGLDNMAGGNRASIGGGSYNVASGSLSVIGGGISNSIPHTALGATIAGGMQNTIIDWEGAYSTIAGGRGNQAGAYASVGGGQLNRAHGGFSVVGGGFSNNNTAHGTTIAGGIDNATGSPLSTVGGGTANRASGEFSTIAGGLGNLASRDYCTVGGGHFNEATNTAATVAGGDGNRALNNYASVGGGKDNSASGYGSTIAGGSYNTNNGVYPAIGGGMWNTAAGLYATVPGGILNVADAHYSFAAGYRAQAKHQGAFVWADASHLRPDDPSGTAIAFTSIVTNEFAVRATGGVRFVTAIDTNGTSTAGVSLTPGSGTWSSLSDRNAKENFTPAQSREVLDKVTALPIATWNYKSQDKSIRHIGPTAQDFHAAFNLGENDRTITTVDADGVALAAIQGLNQILREQAAELQSKDAEIEELRCRLSKLEGMLLNPLPRK